jgi:sialic acid synthase SpsE
MSEIVLNNGLKLGDGHPVWIVAEIGLCHNGNPDRAKEMIRYSVEAGADAVKFQKRDVDNLAIGEVLDSPDKRFPSFGKTYREVRHHIEFGLDIYRELKAYADSLSIPFFASVFDIKSADQMAEIDVPALKIASHCLSNQPLIEHLCDLRIPVLLSTGMAYYEEINETVERLKKNSVPLALYHCVSAYPHTYKIANLKMLNELKQRYDVPVGYSSHELDNYAAFLATAMGAFSVEKHVTLDRGDEGFDHNIAQDMSGLKDLVDGIRKAKGALGDGKKTVSEEEWITRKKYHSSIVSAQTIKRGTVITRNQLTIKNPGSGIPAREIDSVLGKKAAIDIKEDVLILSSMIEKLT